MLQAQNLGPFRQFLAFEGSYSRLQLDVGDGESRLGLNGYGGRLWINLAPFLPPGRGVKDHTAIALSYFKTVRDRGIKTNYYGAELNLYPMHVPFGNLIDPFVSLGAGRFGISNRVPGTGATSSVDLDAGTRHYLALTPGIGIRVPIPNRFQLRFDAGDVILFNRRDRNGNGSTAHNPEFKAGIGLTF